MLVTFTVYVLIASEFWGKFLRLGCQCAVDSCQSKLANVHNVTYVSLWHVKISIEEIDVSHLVGWQPLFSHSGRSKRISTFLSTEVELDMLVTFTVYVLIASEFWGKFLRLGCQCAVDSCQSKLANVHNVTYVSLWHVKISIEEIDVSHLVGWQPLFSHSGRSKRISTFLSTEVELDMLVTFTVYVLIASEFWGKFLRLGCQCAVDSCQSKLANVHNVTYVSFSELWMTLLFVNWVRLQSLPWTGMQIIRKRMCLFSLHIHSMWETICEAQASWSGWEFGSKIPVYPILGFGSQNTPPPPENWNLGRSWHFKTFHFWLVENTPSPQIEI